MWGKKENEMRSKFAKIALIISFLIICKMLSAEDVNAIEKQFAKGNEYAKCGKYDEAITCYMEVIKSLPENEKVHYNLGAVYGKKNIWENAIKEYEKALEINPKYINACYNLGIAYGNIGKWDMSFSFFNKLVKLSPKDPDAHYNLALIGVILRNKRIIAQEYKILEKIAPNLAMKIEDLISRANLSIV
jgi:tetratricopeptide (TPR) repeat protein